MRPLALQLLTWGTAVAAVSSAAWLSSTSEHTLLCSLEPRAAAFDPFDLDGYPPTDAGPPAGTGAASEASPRGREATFTE
ncbi:MAG TPA: hypothetical protein VH328_09125 [Burkholderiaceae bacterium]|jgi:hypothetical protein|nr:hypothetical protein [Burkholderiaceae bacterium]